MRGQLGSLDAGAAADLVVLNDDLQVLKTFINGRLEHAV
jgi:N-acetylglucosamine-6-phosphate deacetylase